MDQHKLSHSEEGFFMLAMFLISTAPLNAQIYSRLIFEITQHVYVNAETREEKLVLVTKSQLPDHGKFDTFQCVFSHFQNEEVGLNVLPSLTTGG